MKDNQVAVKVDINMIFQKFANQWSTLQKAYKDLDIEKNGKVRQFELQHFLHHWGIETSKKEFDEIFTQFDHDQDGFISYHDLQNTVGKVILP